MTLVPRGVCSNCGYWAQFGEVVRFLADYCLCFGCIQNALDLLDHPGVVPASEEYTA